MGQMNGTARCQGATLCTFKFSSSTSLLGVAALHRTMSIHRTSTRPDRSAGQRIATPSRFLWPYKVVFDPTFLTPVWIADRTGPVGRKESSLLSRVAPWMLPENRDLSRSHFFPRMILLASVSSIVTCAGYPLGRAPYWRRRGSSCLNYKNPLALPMLNDNRFQSLDMINQSFASVHPP